MAQIQALWPKSKQNGPNPSMIAQIKAKWPKSGQKTPILTRGTLFWPLRPILWPPIPRFWPDLGHFAWIWAIMLGFGPFCLDLGHIAWIWAIWQNLGQNRPQRRRSPEDGVGGTDERTYVRTDGRIPPVFYRTLSPLGPLPKKQIILRPSWTSCCLTSGKWVVILSSSPQIRELSLSDPMKILDALRTRHISEKDSRQSCIVKETDH